MLVAGKHNSKNYPAFFSESEDDDQIIDSFRQRVMVPVRPVAHLAVTINMFLVETERFKVSLLDLVENAPFWLSGAVETAEKLRVVWGDLFPNKESSHAPRRSKNFYIPPREMIAILPYVDPLP